MCGIIALMLANQYEHCNQGLLDGLTVLQHRGQGALALTALGREAPARRH